MNALKNFKLAGVSMLVVVGVAACNNPWSTESASKSESADKSMDQAAKDTGEKTSSAAGKIGSSLERQSSKAGVAINDAEITTKVKGAILVEPGLKSLDISVDTVKGVVTLSGSVDSIIKRERAQTLASEVDGVTSVDNQLALTSSK